MGSNREAFQAAELRSVLARELAEAVGEPLDDASFTPLHGAGLVADATTKLLVRTRDGAPRSVVLVASPVSPALVARGAERAALARQALGSELGRVVLEPLRTGVVAGLSWVAWPYRRPFSNGAWTWRWQRRSLRPRVLEWLRGVARATRGAPEPDAFRRALASLAVHAAASAPVRRAAEGALDRLAKDRWRPFTVLSHNDLWKANLLRGDGEPFVVIDWPGGAVRGHPIYDLVRVSDSLACRGRELERELAAHAAILECDPEDTRSYLLAALGAIGLELEHFPVELYARIVERCLALHDGRPPGSRCTH